MRKNIIVYVFLGTKIVFSSQGSQYVPLKREGAFCGYEEFHKAQQRKGDDGAPKTQPANGPTHCPVAGGTLVLGGPKMSGFKVNQSNT